MKSQAHRNLLKFAFVAALLAATAVGPAVIAQAKNPKYTVKEVMQAIHKGQDNIGKRAAQGAASKDDIAKLAEYYESLPQNEPPRGEIGSWKEKTGKLVAASKALQAGNASAAEMYKNASNCKACHNVHKPEDQ
jgi:hypothetical protein